MKELCLSFISTKNKLTGYRTLNKRPMGLDALLEHQFGHLPKFNITAFLPQGVEIELIFALGPAVSEIWANFQNCYI